MRFETLQQRLLEYVREVVRNGDATERSLARLTGISQPHMHNVLKGVRSMNSEIADIVLERLGLSIYDLFEASELSNAAMSRVAEQEGRIEAPVFVDRLGPGLPWPSEVSLFERFPVPFRIAAGIHNPVVVRLANDPRMFGVLNPGLALLDRSESRRRAPDAASLWAVCLGGEGLIRWVRLGRAGVYLAAADCLDCPNRWEYVRIRARDLPEIVKARVTILKTPEPSRAPRRLPGRSQEPILRRAAS
jgi:hypothetical protein